MYSFSDPLREVSDQRGDSDFLFQFYGQAAPLNRELPAAELVALLVAEAREILGSKG